MPRVKRGNVRRAKRKKLLARAKGFYQTKSKLYRSAKESVDTALKYAFVGRRRAATRWRKQSKRLRPERGAESPSESERGWGPASAEKC